MIPGSIVPFNPISLPQSVLGHRVRLLSFSRRLSSGPFPRRCCFAEGSARCRPHSIALHGSRSFLRPFEFVSLPAAGSFPPRGVSLCRRPLNRHTGAVPFHGSPGKESSEKLLSSARQPAALRRSSLAKSSPVNLSLFGLFSPLIRSPTCFSP